MKEGCLTLYDEKKGLVPRYFFLFSDVLVWSNESKFNGNSVVYRGHMPIELGRTTVRPSIDLVQLPKAKKMMQDMLELGWQQYKMEIGVVAWVRYYHSSIHTIHKNEGATPYACWYTSSSCSPSTV